MYTLKDLSISHGGNVLRLRVFSDKNKCGILCLFQSFYGMNKRNCWVYYAIVMVVIS